MSETPAEPPVELGILTATKKGLGIPQDHTSFDSELILFINSVFSDLTQLGIGPASGFEIEDATLKWSDFLGGDKRFNAAKAYMVHRVRLMFDIPDNYAVVNAIKEEIAKAEWRLNVAREDALNDTEASKIDSLVDLIITAGLPFGRRVRVSGGTNVWPTLVDFEVRSQIRREPNSISELLGDLRPYITPSIDGVDIVLDIEMSGAQTRLIPEGYFDIVISDPGSTDTRAISVLTGRIKIKTLVTAVTDG